MADTEEISSGVLIGFGLVLATLAILILNLILLWFATLRENQSFWTHAGGYPVFLRDLVLWAFHPLLIGNLCLLSGISMISCSKICGSWRFFILETVMLVVCWALIATSGYIAFKNNIINLLNGAPIHHHDKS